MDWKTVKKIDAHIHLLPNNELKQNEVWNKADKDIYLDIMKNIILLKL